MAAVQARAILTWVSAQFHCSASQHRFWNDTSAGMRFLAMREAAKALGFEVI
jgi:hypothetical protein